MDNSTIDKILNLSQQILQHQNTILTMVFGITALLLACTWMWNFFISRRQIKNEIQKRTSKLEKDLWIRADDKIQKLEKGIEEKFRKELLSREAEIHRLFALGSKQVGFIDISSKRWAKALKSYNLLGEERLIRISVDAILHNLKEVGVVGELDKAELQDIIDIVNRYVPSILDNEKKEILNILGTELKKK